MHECVLRLCVDMVWKYTIRNPTKSCGQYRFRKVWNNFSEIISPDYWLFQLIIADSFIDVFRYQYK